MALLTEPLLLAPALVPKPWGGAGLGAGIGEAWDLSTHPAGPSVVASGPHRGRTLAELVAEAPDDVGGPVQLLAKRLDCAGPLSVQVHPAEGPDTGAGHAKTEAWVVLGAAPGAGVWLGVAAPTEAATLAAAALDGTLPELLQFVELTVGQAVFVPAGTIHAIGGGLALFELQQSSDITYRLFDWGREGRELHLEAGLACATLTPTPTPTPGLPRAPSSDPVRLVACDHFVIDRCPPTAATPLDPGGSWVAVHVVAGTAHLGSLALAAGSTALVPRAAGPARLEPGPGFDGLRYGPP